MQKKILFVSAFAVLAAMQATAQTKIGDNPATINPDAILELESTNRGLLLPRIALTSTVSAAPLSAHVAGMVVYNTATNNDVTPGYYFDNGGSWLRIADNSTVRANNGLTRVGDSVKLGGTLTMPTALTATGANNLIINTTAIGSANNDINQGFTVIAQAATNNRAIGNRTSLIVPTGTTLVQARGSSSTANVEGTISGTATGAYMNTVLRPGSNVATGSTVTGASGDVEVLTGTTNLDNTRTLTGARFGADAANGTAARTTGVTATAVSSTSSNIGVAASANTTEADLKAQIAANVPTGTSAATYSYAPAGANNFATYSDGNVRMQNLPAVVTADTILSSDVNGNVSRVPASVLSNNISANNGLTRVADSIKLGGALTMPTTLTTTGTNNLVVQANDIGSASSEVNQGLNILATATTTNNNASALRGRVLQTGGTVAQLRGVTGVATSNGGTVSGSSNGGYFNNQLAGGTLSGAAIMTAVSGDVEATAGTASAANAMIGGRFGATVSGSVAAGRAVGVLATAGGSTTANIGTLSVINDPTLTSANVLTAGGAVSGANNGAAVVAINPATTNNNYAIYSDGNVALRNLPATGNTALVGIDTATGKLSTTAIPAAGTASNGLTKTGNDVQLGGPLTKATAIGATGANNLVINSSAIGSANNDLNQGFTVISEAATNNRAIGTRSSLLVPTGVTLTQARGSSNTTNVAGTINGTATGSYNNTVLRPGSNVATGSTVTGASGDVEVIAGTTNLDSTRTLTGARFGADATNGVAARTTGVTATAVGSTSSNIGVATSANTTEADLKAQIAATVPAGTSAATYSYAPAGANSIATYSDGNVRLQNLGTTTATNLLGVDAAGNVSTTAIPALVRAGNGLTRDMDTVKLGGVLTEDVILDGATNQKGITLLGNGNTEVGIFKVQNNFTAPNPSGISNFTQVVTSSLDNVTGSGAQSGDVVAHVANAFSSSDDHLVIGSNNFGSTPLSSATQGDYLHAIGTNGFVFANGQLAPSAPNAMVIGVSGGVSFNDGNSNWNAIGTEGYLNFNNSTSGKAAAGHFDGNGAENGGTGFGMVGSMGDVDLYQTVFDPALAGYHVGVAAVNHTVAPSATDLALYTEGNVMMKNLSAGTGTDIITRDASGNVGFVKAFAAQQTLTFVSAAANSVSDQLVSVTGVEDGDAIYLGVPSGAVVPFGSYSAFVSAPGVVTVRFTNNSATTQSPSGLFKIKVMQ